MWLILVLCCGSKESFDSSIETEQVDSPLASWQGTLPIGGELRWLIEGVVPADSEISLSYSFTDIALVDVTVFSGLGVEDAIWGTTIAENSAYQETISCGEPTCTISYVTKAIHGEGAVDVDFELAVFSEHESAVSLITLLQ